MPGQTGKMRGRTCGRVHRVARVQGELDTRQRDCAGLSVWPSSNAIVAAIGKTPEQSLPDNVIECGDVLAPKAVVGRSASARDVPGRLRGERPVAADVGTIANLAAAFEPVTRHVIGVDPGILERNRPLGELPGIALHTADFDDEVGCRLVGRACRECRHRRAKRVYHQLGNRSATRPTPSAYRQMSRVASASDGSRPSGVNLSTAAGKSRLSLVSSSSRERPVCCISVLNASDPMACSSWSGRSA